MLKTYEHSTLWLWNLSENFQTSFFPKTGKGRPSANFTKKMTKTTSKSAAQFHRFNLSHKFWKKRFWKGCKNFSKPFSRIPALRLKKYFNNISIFLYFQIVCNCTEHGNNVSTNFREFSKAFDCVTHGILFRKIYAQGIRQEKVALFQSPPKKLFKFNFEKLI